MTQTLTRQERIAAQRAKYGEPEHPLVCFCDSCHNRRNKALEARERDLHQAAGTCTYPNCNCVVQKTTPAPATCPKNLTWK